MCKCCSPRTATIIRSVYAGVGIVLGLIVCAVFSVVFENRYLATASWPDPSPSALQTACHTPGLGARAA